MVGENFPFVSSLSKHEPVPFAREVLRRFQLPRLRAPVISGEMFTPKRLQELFQHPQHCLFAPAKHIRQDLSGLVIDSSEVPGSEAVTGRE